MSDQPKPTGEWTEWTGKRITNFLTQRSAKELADEITVALATERERLEAKWKASMVDVTAAANKAQEWTGLSLSRLIKQKGYKGAADVHNAALAAERQQLGQQIVERNYQIETLTEQLAAEREKVQTLMDALKCVRKILGPHMKKHWINGLTIIDAALAKVGK